MAYESVKLNRIMSFHAICTTGSPDDVTEHLSQNRVNAKIAGEWAGIHRRTQPDGGQVARIQYGLDWQMELSWSL